GRWPVRPHEEPSLPASAGSSSPADTARVIPPQEQPPLQTAPQEQTRVGQFCDSLPAGALARLGTLRLRHGAAIDILAFSRAGGLLAGGSRDGALCVWDTSTGKEVRRLSGEYHQITSLVFSPDGRRLACAEAGRPAVRVWDVETGSEQPALRGHTGSVRKVAFGLGDTLLSAGSDGTLRLWDVRTGREVRQL